MFQEFTLKPDAREKLLLSCFFRLSVYLLCCGFVLGWIKFAEPETLISNPLGVYGTLGFMVVVSLMAAFRTYQSGIKFYLIANDSGIEAVIGSTQMRFSYADIQRIELDPGSILRIYTNTSATTPVISLSEHITNRFELEQILNKHCPIVPGRPHSLLLNRNLQYLVLFVFMAGGILNFISERWLTQMVGGIGALAALIYTGIIFYRFRRESQNRRAVLGLVVIVLLILVRLYFIYESSRQ